MAGIPGVGGNVGKFSVLHGMDVHILLLGQQVGEQGRGLRPGDLPLGLEGVVRVAHHKIGVLLIAQLGDSFRVQDLPAVHALLVLLSILAGGGFLVHIQSPGVWPLGSSKMAPQTVQI